MFGISDWVTITGKESTRTEHCLIKGAVYILWFELIKIGE